MRKRRALTEESLSAFYVPVTETGCWLWLGVSQEAGYGRVYVEGRRRTMAHRLMYELRHGVKIPKGMLACHKCDTPSCVNPDHIFIGTYTDNRRDMDRKGRARFVRGEEVITAVLTEQQAREVLVSTGPASKVAARYGVSRTAIYAIRNGKYWKHIRQPKQDKAA